MPFRTSRVVIIDEEENTNMIRLYLSRSFADFERLMEVRMDDPSEIHQIEFRREVLPSEQPRGKVNATTAKTAPSHMNK